MESTTTIKIYNFKNHEVNSEKALVAFDVKTNKICAIGNECEILARQNVNENFKITSPFSFGAISDYKCCEKLVKYLMTRYGNKKLIGGFGTALIILDDAVIEEDNVKAYEDMVYSAGSRNLYVIPNKSKTEFVENISHENAIWEYGKMIKCSIAVEFTHGS